MLPSSKKLKLDLHTHLCEATGYPWLNEDLVKWVVNKVKEKGLDGIGVTEHDFPSYGFQFKKLAEELFDHEVVIIPGQELSAWPVEIVELYLPGDMVFSFLAHPGFPPTDFSRSLHRVQGIEVGNALHSRDMNVEKIRTLAQEHNLLLLTNSDAHGLDDLGSLYNELSLEELYSRAKPGTPKGMRGGRL